MYYCSGGRSVRKNRGRSGERATVQGGVKEWHCLRRGNVSVVVFRASGSSSRSGGGYSKRSTGEEAASMDVKVLAHLIKVSIITTR